MSIDYSHGPPLLKVGPDCLGSLLRWHWKKNAACGIGSTLLLVGSSTPSPSSTLAICCFVVQLSPGSWVCAYCPCLFSQNMTSLSDQDTCLF